MRRTSTRIRVRVGPGAYGAHALVLSRYAAEAFAGYKDGSVRIIRLTHEPDGSKAHDIGASPIEWAKTSASFKCPVSAIGEWSRGVLLVGLENGQLEHLTMSATVDRSDSGQREAGSTWRRYAPLAEPVSEPRARPEATSGNPHAGGWGRPRFMGPLSRSWFLISTDTSGWLIPRTSPQGSTDVSQCLAHAIPRPGARRLLCAVRIQGGPNTPGPGWLTVARDGRIGFMAEGSPGSDPDPRKPRRPGALRYLDDLWLDGDRPSIALDYAVEKSRAAACGAGPETDRQRYVVDERARSLCLLTDRGLFRIRPGRTPGRQSFVYGRVPLPDIGPDCAVITLCEAAPVDGQAPDAPRKNHLWVWDREGRGVVFESPTDRDDRADPGAGVGGQIDLPWRWRFCGDVDGDVGVVHAVAWSEDRGRPSRVVALGLQERVSIYDIESTAERIDRSDGKEPATTTSGPSTAAATETANRSQWPDDIAPSFAFARDVIEGEGVDAPPRESHGQRLLRLLRDETDRRPTECLQCLIDHPRVWSEVLLMWVDAVLGVLVRRHVEPRQAIIYALTGWVRRLQRAATESLLTSAERSPLSEGVFERAADRAIARALKWGLEGGRFRERPDLFHPRRVLVLLGDGSPHLRALERAIYETLMFQRRFDEAWHSQRFTPRLATSPAEPPHDPRLSAVRTVLVAATPRREASRATHAVVARILRRGPANLWWRTFVSAKGRPSGIDGPVCRAEVSAPDDAETLDAIFVRRPDVGKVLLVRLEAPRSPASTGAGDRADGGQSETDTVLSAHEIDLGASAEMAYRVPRRDRRNNKVLQYVRARSLGHKRSKKTGREAHHRGDERFDAIAPAGGDLMLVGVSVRGPKPATTLALYRVTADEPVFEEVGALARGVIRSAYPASGSTTADNPVRCIAVSEGRPDGSEPAADHDWDAIACTDGRIWAGRLQRGSKGQRQSCEPRIGAPQLVARVSGRPTALAIRVHPPTSNTPEAVRVFTGTEDGSVMAFEHTPESGDGQGPGGARPASPTPGWVSLWSTFEDGPIDSIHARNAWDHPYDPQRQASSAAESDGASTVLEESRPWVVVVTRAGRLSIFDDSSPNPSTAGEADWAGLSRSRRPLLPGERFDRGRVDEPIIGSAFMRTPPIRDAKDGDPDQFHARLVVGTADGDIRILQLRQLEYTGWRRWRRKRFLEPTWRTVHALEAKLPADGPPLALYRMRRCEAVKHIVPELADNHVAWLLEQYESERRPSDREFVRKIVVWKAYPAHLARVAELALAWNTGMTGQPPEADDPERAFAERLAQRLENALDAAHEIGDIGVYKAILRATMARMNREIALTAAGKTSERSSIGAMTYGQLFDTLARSIERWRARPDVYIRLRILMQQRASDGQSLSRVVDGVAVDTREGPAAYSVAKPGAGVGLKETLRVRVDRAADNLAHGDLLLALEVLRAVNAAIIRTGWQLIRARTERCTDVAHWRPGRRDDTTDSGAEVFRWEDISRYYDALADFVARLGNSRSGLGDAVLHEVVRAFALGVCITPTAAAAIAYRIAETNLPDELVGRIVNQFALLHRQGLPAPHWARLLFRAAAAHASAVTDIGPFSLANRHLVRQVLGLDTHLQWLEEQVDVDGLLDGFTGYTLRDWPNPIARRCGRQPLTDAPGSPTTVALVDAAIGEVNRIVLAPWIRYDLTVQWLVQTAKALAQDAAKVDLEPLLWLVHAMQRSADDQMSSSPGAPQGYSYHHSWVFWHLVTSYLLPATASGTGSDPVPEFQSRLAAEAFDGFDGGLIRRAVALSLEIPEGPARRDIWTSASEAEKAISETTRQQVADRPDREVQPALVVAAPYLEKWATCSRVLLKKLEEHNELFRPQVALYDAALSAFQDAAGAFPTSAAVQANIVQGVLGHSLLESISDLTCHLYAIAQVVDPQGTWNPPQRDDSQEPHTDAKNVPLAERLSRVLTQRAFDAQSIPKNLLLLAELTARSDAFEDPLGSAPDEADEAGAADDNVDLAVLAEISSDPDLKFPWTVKRLNTAGRVSERVATILRMVLRELGHNQIDYGEEPTGTMMVDGLRRRLILQTAYRKSDGAGDRQGDDKASRVEELLKGGLQRMVPPHPSHPGKSHGMGLYLSNLALSTVRWRLAVKPDPNEETGPRGLEFIIEPALVESDRD